MQGCKDAKEVVALAKSKGIDLTEEKAAKIFGLVQNDKLSDTDLGQVVGGCHGADKLVDTVKDTWFD